MQRVVIVGAGGSGKTVLARRLGVLFGLPVAHLDGLFYDGDFNPVPSQEFAAAQERLIREERWVADGNYASTLPLRLGRADTVVFLDLPGWVCLAGLVRRRLVYRGGRHPASGVYDRLGWGFVAYVASYRRRMAPRVAALIAAHAGHAEVHVLRSRRAVDRWLADLAEVEQAGGIGTRSAPLVGGGPDGRE